MSIVLESYERDFEKFLATSNKLMNSFHLTDEGYLLSSNTKIFHSFSAKKEMILQQIKKNLTDAEGNVCFVYLSY